MHHATPLIGTIVAGLVVAFLMGALAQRLKISPIAGYLLAGVLVGPFTPGFVADGKLANELAEIGVILLMFGVGLHFSLRDLMAVKAIAIPGALVQIATATALGMGLSWAMGWTPIAGFIFGLALSVASTVVLLRALQVRNLVETERGQIAIGWLIVEDIVMVLALVMLPPLARIATNPEGADLMSIAQPMAATLFKVAGFVMFMLVIGRRVIPHVLHWVVHTGSRELFRLAVLAIALGVAFGAAFVFEVSLALGAFFAGMILGETTLSRRAAEETLPLRDAFAVLFFVSVGMLFNPHVLVQQPLPLLATVAIIIIGKSIAAYGIARMFRKSHRTSLTIACSLAQIGEFSFILASLGTSLGVLPAEARDLILAGAIISIFVNPFLFSWVMRMQQRFSDADALSGQGPAGGHIVIIGHGRVGQHVAAALQQEPGSLVVIEDNPDKLAKAQADGLATVRGDAVDNGILEKAGIGRASALILAIPEGYEAGAIHQRARSLNPDLKVIARAHSEDEYAHLARLGVRHIVRAEQETARRMVDLLHGS
ncbi:YbaL family putative K(+) efflux transporter [Blastomonas sp. SL216]|uniref:YbaL family putative K(+) efflux transporter n=1 Tax=Blastomonas sp. SL216 TaxID=2995169 RepID=UPI0023774EA5|nr:Kef family K(+) transporter [Blastomonas sp. SL216]